MSDPITPDPAPAANPEPAAAQPSASNAGEALQPNIAAALACFFSVLGGIVFLVLEKKNQFVRFYAMQSVLFGVVAIVLFIVVAIVNTVLHVIPLIGPLIGLLLSLVVFLGIGAVSVITIVKAFLGKEWEIPVLGPIARKQLISGPLSKL
jgi:uncharacterized membrane protein